MHVDPVNLIGPAAFSVAAFVWAAGGRQPRGALAVALMMTGSIVLYLLGAQHAAIVAEVLGVLLAVALFLYERRWQSQRRNVPFNVRRFLKRIFALVAAAAVLAVGINSSLGSVRLLSWVAVGACCLGILYVGLRGSDESDNES
ncbi:hypothetical protein R70006_06307 [Paraburkholderia domus]|uniref:hypothetical protein n=1 Tax=Paraburkholderia domus TaxID=2793075 RepID=UPI0019126986|nr:hypothetical protein [Paraburkholderia domus]MBK5052934.1 hypothetical protein [Burkholderia sp. R-70006]CAE6823227.1 hypothetical protein R70006_06307 [Paraburkholderia domus]